MADNYFKSDLAANWPAFMSAILSAGQTISAYSAARFNSKIAQRQAETNARLERAGFERRAQYRSEELANEVWNLRQRTNELVGKQQAAIGGSGFGVSTGEQRLIADALRRGYEQEEGLNRSAYLQQFEDEVQTQINILHYNAEARMQKMIQKRYSGLSLGAAVASSALGSFMKAYQPTGNRGKVASATNLGGILEGGQTDKFSYVGKKPYSLMG